MSARLRLVRTQAIWSRSNRVIVPTGFSWEETAVKDAPAPPQQLADRRRNKRERYSRDISVVPRPPNLLSRDPFVRASLLRPLPKAMTRITRRRFRRLAERQLRPSSDGRLKHISRYPRR